MRSRLVYSLYRFVRVWKNARTVRKTRRVISLRPALGRMKVKMADQRTETTAASPIKKTSSLRARSILPGYRAQFCHNLTHCCNFVLIDVVPHVWVEASID